MVPSRPRRRTLLLASTLLLSTLLAGCIAPPTGDVEAAHAGATCAEGEVVTGFNGDGAPICTPLPAADALLPACASGEVVKREGSTWACAGDVDTDTDTDTTYDASAGLLLDGTTFRLDAPSCASDEHLVWDAADARLACDADADTTYDAAGGLTLAGTTFSLDTTDLAACTAPDQKVTYDAAAGRLACADDVDTDTDTTYAAGSGLLLDGTTFALAAPDPCAAGETLTWTGTALACVADVDTDTTYAAGTGLVLAEGAFRLDAPTCAASEKLTWNGAGLGCAGDADTTYEAGAGLLLNAADHVLSLDADGIATCTGTGSKVVWDAAAARLACAADQDTTYTAGSGLALAGSLMSIADGGVDTVHLADGAVTLDKLAAMCAHGERLQATAAGWSCVAPQRTAGHADALLAASSGHLDVAIGADGLPVMVHQNAADQLEVVHCEDIACTTVTTAIVDSEAGVGAGASIAIGVDGLPIISYQDPTFDSDPRFAALLVAHCEDVRCATATIRMLNVGNGQATFTSIAIGADGLPAVAAYNAGNADLALTRCADIVCTSTASGVNVDNDGDVGAWVSLAIGRDGNPVMSYHDATNGALKVVHCDEPACWNPNPNETVIDDLAAGVVGTHTSLTIGSDGNPVIAYHDEENGALKVAHCTTLDCTSFTTATLDTGGVGTHASVVTARDGNHLVSYVGDGVVRVARCFDLGCTTASTWSAGTEAPGDAPTRLAVGVDGMPVLAYLDGPDAEARLVHFANAFAIPYHDAR